MEDLFWTTLSTGGREERLHIVFAEEEYRFLSADGETPRYRFRRERDEWQAVDPASEAVKDEAVDALEQYLLQQH